MNDTSKEAINTLFKEDIMLSQFHSKYEMLTVMCQEETINPMDFINQHKQMVDPVLQQLGIDIQSTQTEDLFKQAINGYSDAENAEVIRDCEISLLKCLWFMKIYKAAQSRFKKSGMQGMTSQGWYQELLQTNQVSLSGSI
jgi:hypothetical protein